MAFEQGEVLQHAVLQTESHIVRKEVSHIAGQSILQLLTGVTEGHSNHERAGGFSCKSGFFPFDAL